MIYNEIEVYLHTGLWADINSKRFKAKIHLRKFTYTIDYGLYIEFTSNINLDDFDGWLMSHDSTATPKGLHDIENYNWVLQLGKVVNGQKNYYYGADLTFGTSDEFSILEMPPKRISNGSSPFTWSLTNANNDIMSVNADAKVPTTTDYDMRTFPNGTANMFEPFEGHSRSEMVDQLLSLQEMHYFDYKSDYKKNNSRAWLIYNPVKWAKTINQKVIPADIIEDLSEQTTYRPVTSYREWVYWVFKDSSGKLTGDDNTKVDISTYFISDNGTVRRQTSTGASPMEVRGFPAFMGDTTPYYTVKPGRMITKQLINDISANQQTVFTDYTNVLRAQVDNEPATLSVNRALSPEFIYKLSMGNGKYAQLICSEVDFINEKSTLGYGRGFI